MNRAYRCRNCGSRDRLSGHHKNRPWATSSRRWCGTSGVPSGLRFSNGEPLGHVLLCGPPGLAKTSLARAVAAELGRGCRTVLAPFVSEPCELARHVAEIAAG